MNSFQISTIITFLFFSFDLSQAQVGCQGKTGLSIVARNNEPSALYLQCASGQLIFV